MKSYEWRTNVRKAQRDGCEWECWKHWCWTWQWCKIGFNHIYYDGEQKIFSFGIGTLTTYSDNNYRDRKGLTLNN